MTRYSLFTTLFLVIFLMSSQTSSAGTHTHTNGTTTASVSDFREMSTAAADPGTPVENTPGLPATTKSHHPVEKTHTPSMNELAHIHHFHKERVKKIKRHHGKCWLLSKLLLIVCHIALLVIAYLHVIH